MVDISVVGRRGEDVGSSVRGTASAASSRSSWAPPAQAAAATPARRPRPSASVTETFQATLDIGFGLGLGTWNATSGTCTLALSSGSAKEGDAFQAAASVAGAYGVQVGDAGRLTAPVGHTLTVAHP
jgi:hypothetical protein